MSAKNNFKRVEYQLYNYKAIDIKVKNLEIDINRLMNDMSLGGGDMFAEKSSPTYAVNSPVENEVIRREEKEIGKQISLLRSKKQYLIEDKEKIENALTLLSDIEYKLIELRYFNRNRLTWVNIALQLGYDETYCRKLRTRVINKLFDFL